MFSRNDVITYKYKYIYNWPKDAMDILIKDTSSIFDLVLDISN